MSAKYHYLVSSQLKVTCENLTIRFKNAKCYWWLSWLY